MEFTVDSALESHINTPLKSVADAKAAIQVEDENEMSDGEDDNGTDPISKITRDAIYSQLASAKQDDPYIDSRKVMMVKGMTEGEGKSYLDVLRSQRSVAFSRAVTRKVVGNVATALCNPKDDCTPILATTDDSMIDELAHSLGWVFSHLGALKGYAMMGIYIASSWTKNWDDQFTQWTEKKNLDKALGNVAAAATAGPQGDYAPTPVQSNGGEPKSNG